MGAIGDAVYGGGGDVASAPWEVFLAIIYFASFPLLANWQRIKRFFVGTPEA